MTKSLESSEIPAVKATLSKDHSRRFPIEEDYRPPFRRDVDRIIHSKAYSRYSDKTQVVYLMSNDHITHRSLHVQLVSNFAKGIAEVLKLNGDLVEAIALGHDVGHPPFGHEGENYLSELSVEYGMGTFQHPIQSCRLFTEIEPLNLGLQVYDGFLSHDGAMQGREIFPRFDKSWDEHFEDIAKKRVSAEVSITPATLEGALVKFCDTISYIGKDLEDAIALNIIKREDVPVTVLGTYNKSLLTYLAQDIIHQSLGKEFISLSQESWDAIKVLRRFNFNRIYQFPPLKSESVKIQRAYRLLFEILLNDFEEKGEKSMLFRNFLNSKTAHYIKSATPVEKVIDYISGMTDNYFLRLLENLLIPQKIILKEC